MVIALLASAQEFIMPVSRAAAIRRGDFDGVIKGLANATSASGRRHPSYWGKDRPTSYAMEPGVTALFAAARERIGR